MAGQGSGATILKILSGVQAGVDVPLADGTYLVGQGDDDDIQIFDISLKPGHLRLTLGGGKIVLAAASGSVRTRNGITLSPGDEGQEIEQLDIVSAGTTRFALGAPTANWASVTDVETGAAAGPAKSPAPPEGAGLARRRAWQVALPVLAVLVLLGGGAALLPILNAQRAVSSEQMADDDLARVRTAVGSFDFGRRLRVEQEVDGAIFVTGYVETPVERRAIQGAVRETDVPARVRLPVLGLIRSEVENLIKAEGAQVRFALDDDGALTLSGLVRDPARAEALVGTIRERIDGLSGVTSEIRTAPMILADVRALADRSQIAPYVIFRLDGTDLLEVSGIVPTDRIDAWVGFLQAYATQFAETMPLRSLVQLQRPDGTVGRPGETPQTGLFLGAGTTSNGDQPVDVERLRTGRFDMADIFAGETEPPAPAASEPAPAAPEDERQAVRQLIAAGGSSAATLPEPTPREPSGDTRPASDPAGTALREEPAGRPAEITASAPGAQDPPASNGQGSSPSITRDPLVADVGASPRDSEPPINDLARDLVERWEEDRLPGSAAGRSLAEGLQALQNWGLGVFGAETRPVAERYQPLLAGPLGQPDALQACWPGSRLERRSVLGALFWLDLLSVSRELTMVDLPASEQSLVLEAALNPRGTGQCADAAAGRPFQSVYLVEASRNDRFVDFITRDLAPFPIEVAGVSLLGDRFVQTRTGEKMRQGAARDRTSRLALVGELGLAFEQSTGYSTHLFGNDLNWRVQ
ncbi:FHA domain-containing protein [Antarcticirhabdus aurantiaca]|uniref:Uncharacterized protein n=1 Tax=Antarcticirhabdus aurantiaca TaxID=2606717 RepID=A0ACD4NUR2_9HYPH|nr:FHA domain-containing protein [Antarcticirhabdus aurantiaca]WAJ30489.1 hypothetical protein OXU80_09920 [Jeongeuplla avenae]